MSTSRSPSAPSNKGKQAMVPVTPATVKEGEKPEWLDVLVRTTFWEPCKDHGTRKRAENCMFCLHCYQVTCPHCNHNESGHHLLKIRRYLYRSVVVVKDLEEIDIDVSRIQPYVINFKNVVHLRPSKKSELYKPQHGTPSCLTCGSWLHAAPNLFCSLVCEGKLDVSRDDFSGPEAERRYRSSQRNMLPQQPSDKLSKDEDQDEAPMTVNLPEPFHAPPAATADQGNHPVNHSYRRRTRKQAVPQRAFFF